MRTRLSAVGIYSSVLLLAAAPSRSEVYFAAREVLTADHTVDLMVWRFDSTGTGSWDCGPSASPGNPFRLSSCLVRPYARGSGQRDGYLYWAFLNLSPHSQRGDLSPRDPDFNAFFDGLQKPFLALKQRGDSCTYLVSYHNSYAPLAAGRVACPDLARGLAAVDADLAGRPYLVPTDEPTDPSEKRVLRAGEFSRDRPRGFDVGLEAGAALAFGISTDHTEGDGPFAQQVEQVDFNDYADQETMPLALRASITYRDLIGLRVGYAYSAFSMNPEVRRGFQDQFPTVVVSAWDIARHDWTVDLTLGKPFSNASSEFIFYGTLGWAHANFKETAVIDGRRTNMEVLADVTGLWLGGGLEIKIARCVLLGFEPGLYIKDFRLQNSTDQPDGSGNEFQFRIRLGGFHRFAAVR